MITAIYLRVATEITYLLDKKIYMDNEDTLQSFELKKKCLLLAYLGNFLFLMIAGGVFVFLMLKFPIKGNGYMRLTQFLIQTVYLAIWTYSLASLYSDIKSAQDLIPKMKVFKLHFALLLIYLISLFGFTLCFELAMTINKSSNHYTILLIISQILQITKNLVEAITFFVVIFMMLPMTKQQHKKRTEMKQFFLNGFVDFDSILPAIIAENPDMTVEEKQAVTLSIERCKSFFKKTCETQEIVSSLVD